MKGKRKIDARIDNEISHGKYLAKASPEVIWGWATPAGKMRVEERFQLIKEHIGLRTGLKILELGSGTGVYSRKIAKSGVELTAIDISRDLCEKAKAIASAEGLNIVFRVENAIDMSFPDEMFDAVVGVSVLHHLDIDKSGREIYRVLKKGGRIAFSEPNMLNPQIAIERSTPFTRRIFHNSTDETAFVRWTLKSELLACGFRNVVVEPFDFLHPIAAPSIVPMLRRLGKILERIPVVREIAGSLKILAEK